MNLDTAKQVAPLIAALDAYDGLGKKLETAIGGSWIVTTITARADASPSAETLTFALNPELSAKMLAFAKDTYQAEIDQLTGQIEALV